MFMDGSHSHLDADASVDTAPGELTQNVIISLLRVLNKIQQGRRTSHTFVEGDVPMTLVEAEMCAMIDRDPGTTGAELSALLGVTRSATSQVITKLKQKGFVIDVTHPGDAKRRRLYLTDRGVKAASVANEYSKMLVAEVFGGDPAEVAAYQRFLIKLEEFHDKASQWT